MLLDRETAGGGAVGVGCCCCCVDETDGCVAALVCAAAAGCTGLLLLLVDQVVVRVAACGACDSRYLAVFELLSLLVLIHQLQVKLCDFALGHAKDTACVICDASELRRVKICRATDLATRALTNHHLLAQMVMS